MEKLKKFNTEQQYIDSLGVSTYPTVSYTTANVQTKVNILTRRDYSTEYLTFTALEDGTFSFNMYSSLTPAIFTEISYSLDNGYSWTTISNKISTTVKATTPTIHAGETVMWKGIGLKTCATESITNPDVINYMFSSTGRFNVSGNPLSILFGENDEFKTKTTTTNYAALAGLFGNCSKLINAKNLVLKSTTLTSYCYAKMFSGCSSLISVPKLPATTLAEGSYCKMFMSCVNLIVSPELPAANVPDHCYDSMFKSCTKLRSCYDLSATQVGTYGYASMFAECSNLRNGPKINALTLSGYCCQYMFQNCTTLKTAQTLPATTLATYCYDAMFYGCTSLSTPPELPSVTLATYCYYRMFYGCTSLLKSPTLPATTLKDHCYCNMFFGSNMLPDTTNIDFNSSSVISSKGLNGLFAGTKVTDADLKRILPIDENNKYYLPAPTADYCYQNMFQGCTLLKTAPELPATTLKGYQCYAYMFSGCSSLINPPKLPATTLSGSCYHYMFYGCKSLITAPELPATTLTTYCYCYMFYGCTSLINPPKLPATTMVGDCYSFMFQQCTSLVTAPELPATILVSRCYRYMFSGCKSLNYIKAMFTTLFSEETQSWVSGVSSSGTFVKNEAADWSNMFGASSIPNNWNVEQTGTYLTFEALQNGTFTLSVPASVDSTCMSSISYSIDNGVSWVTTFIDNTAQTITTPTITKGDKVLWKGIGNTLTNINNNEFSTFSSTGNFNILGSIMSMLYLDNFVGQRIFPNGSTYNFACLFKNATKLQNTENIQLPATTLTDGCYYSMFYGCSSLKTSPKLPAKILSNYCYSDMFNGCTSLTKTPELCADTLMDNCYYQMFKDCTHIISITMLATDVSASNCLSDWVYNVAASGTFNKSPYISLLPNGSNGIPIGWIINNDYYHEYLTFEALEDGTFSFNIRSGPSLIQSISYSVNNGESWTTLTINSTNETITTPTIIQGNKVIWKGIGTGFGTNGGYATRFSSTGRFNISGNIMSLIYGDEFFNKNLFAYDTYYNFSCLFMSSMVRNAENLMLPVKTLTTSCYGQLFQGCTELIVAPKLPSTTLSNYCYRSMFSGCTSLTTAPELPAITLKNNCYESMFSGCTSLNYIKAMFKATQYMALSNWVYNVAPTGTFVKNSAATWNVTGNSGVPSGWTVETASA